ncbi:citryl-CoA lyase [Burkholderia multivorans]|uniref:Citryl-CoA lyase n=1 Tax=Burkholderia multivorans TaxID=87883 RepID=A0AAP2HQE4_9BURK|nr:citryl-CoA lyase [Burkholderia multivorans]MBU9360742.1 citryl-CoA lyase [Burkholderia multivorans]MBU9366715.1 citryl-CoA lyase [Burkholderia multivorans]MBU9598351.1 citryl-CoA lyase [Burkholderia multivorans]MCA8485863.1 citryl-CoA lyase [Burkholderia multivorans]
MKIGKETVPKTAISASNSETIIVRGKNLSLDLIGKISFTDYFHLLVTGRPATPAATAVLNATLVAIAEHGLVPSVQASRMTLAAAPDALQGAVAAGILGCGSVILGASETAGRLFKEVQARAEDSEDYVSAAKQVVSEYRAEKRAIPGYGHPLHKERDARVDALFDVAKNAEIDMTYVRIAEAIEQAIPGIVGKKLMLNVSAAIPAVLLGIGFPLQALKGVPILARTAGLIGHLTEELEKPIGFALSYQATREVVYDGEVPDGFTPED